MTDFGRRPGDMFKADYDPDENGLVTAAELHGGSHESGEDDEIDVSGLVGAGGAEIIGDGTLGRVLRTSALKIDNGSSGTTLKCTLASRWNGDVVAETDNIAKGASTGGFTLSSDGYLLTVEAAGLSGSVLWCCAELVVNGSSVHILCSAQAVVNDIRVQFQAPLNAAGLDLTTLVDTHYLSVHIHYITTA